MSSPTAHVLELTGDSNIGCRVTFLWQTDRFRHQIALFNGDQIVIVLESADEVRSDDPEWPASPPLQQVHFENRSDSQVALCVGMAGKSHWSASFESQSSNATLHFDIAARIQRSPRFLGSCYRIVLPSFQTEDSALLFQMFGKTFALEVSANDETTWKIESDLLTIAPALQTDARLPLTKRWQYSLRMR